MSRLINGLLDMKTSISQLEYFIEGKKVNEPCVAIHLPPLSHVSGVGGSHLTESLYTMTICFQFVVSAIICKVGLNLDIEYLTPAVVIICELIILIFIMLFTLRLEKVVRDRIVGDDVLNSIANNGRTIMTDCLDELMTTFAKARQILILMFFMISCFSVVFDAKSCCLVSFAIVFVFFAKNMICLLFGKIIERLF